MRCLKCGREYAGNKRSCIYCGASIEGEASQEINAIVDKEGNILVSDKQKRDVKYNDLPEQVRHKIEDAIREGKERVIVKETRTVVRPPLTNAEPERALSLEKVLALLSKMKDSFDKGHIEYNDYERMASRIMKDYISTLDDDIKVDFVVNEIENSEIYNYLDDRILRGLRTFVISTVSDKKVF